MTDLDLPAAWGGALTERESTQKKIIDYGAIKPKKGLERVLRRRNIGAAVALAGVVLLSRCGVGPDVPLISPDSKKKEKTAETAKIYIVQDPASDRQNKLLRARKLPLQFLVSNDGNRLHVACNATAPLDPTLDLSVKSNATELKNEVAVLAAAVGPTFVFHSNADTDPVADLDRAPGYRDANGKIYGDWKPDGYHIADKSRDGHLDRFNKAITTICLSEWHLQYQPNNGSAPAVPPATVPGPPK